MPDAGLILAFLQTILAAIQLAPMAGTAITKRRFRPVAQQLRTIFFSPEETLKTLDRALHGTEFTRLQVQEFAQQFERDEAGVWSALEGLSAKLKAAGLDGALRDEMLLQRIQVGKISIRDKIRQQLYAPLVREEPLNLVALGKLRSDIETINGQIAKLEAALKP